MAMTRLATRIGRTVPPGPGPGFLDESLPDAALREAVRAAVGRFCEGSEDGLDLGSRFAPGTSPLAVAEAVAQALLPRRPGPFR